MYRSVREDIFLIYVLIFVFSHLMTETSNHTHHLLISEMNKKNLYTYHYCAGIVRVL